MGPGIPLLWHTSRPIRNIRIHKICYIRTFPQSLSGSPRSKNESPDRESLQLIECTIVIQLLASVFISRFFLLQSRAPHHFRTFKQCQIWLNHVQLSMKYVFEGNFWKMTMNGDSVYRRQVIWQLEGNIHDLFTTLLCDCTPSDPLHLWMDFWDKICDDL